MSFLAPIAGAVVGGLMGGGESGGQQVSKDPWGPTQEPLKGVISDAEALRQYQLRNPYNSLQMTGYQNMFGDLDAYRGQNNGLMQFANRMMGTNYQRGMPSQPAGLLAQTQPQAGAGLLNPGIFSIPQGAQYGLVDAARFQNELNPYTAINGIKPPEKPAETDAEKERKRREEEQRLARQQGEYYRGEGA